MRTLPWVKLLRAAALSGLLPWTGACARAEPRTAVAPPPTSPAPTDPLENTPVIAIVEQLHLNAHEEWLETYPNVIVSEVVALAIVQPESRGTLLFAHMRGHPRIDGRPLLLGDAVRFLLPVDWRNRDLELADLQGPEFVGVASRGSSSPP